MFPSWIQDHNDIVASASPCQFDLFAPDKHISML